MTKKKRTILFIICFLLFSITLPILLLYNQGYRFDFQSRTFTQTGGFFFKASPKQVEIYLNGKLAKKTDFFFGSVLIDNLLPQEYRIEVKKEGFISWKKTLDIKENLVTEAKSIILFPKKVNFSSLTSNSKDFWLSPDGKKLIIKEENSSSNWSLKLYELDKNIKSHLIESKDIINASTSLDEVSFSSDSQNIEITVTISSQLRYFNIQLNRVPVVLNEISIPQQATNTMLALKKFNDEIYYLDRFGFLYKFNINQQPDQRQRINSNPLQIQPGAAYELAIHTNNYFIKENKTLYYFNQPTNSFERISGDVNDFEISSDLRKIALFTDNELLIFYLLDFGLEKKIGDRVLLTRLSEKITDVAWLGTSYVIFNSGDNVITSEIDDRDNINTVDIAKFKEPRLIWNQNDKRIYILSEGKIHQSDIILP